MTAGVACASNREGAKASQDVVLTCAGFTSGDTATIYWDQPREAAKLGTAEVDEKGTLTFTFLALEVPAGRYTIFIQSQKTSLIATVPFEIRPGIFIVPKSGDPGDVISADLTGFQPSEAVEISWYDTATTTRVLRRITVGEDGSATTTFRAPSSSVGEHTLQATGLAGGKASATFELKS